MVNSMDMAFIWKWIGFYVLAVGICMISVALITDYLIIGVIVWPTLDYKIYWILVSIMLMGLGSMGIAITRDW